MNSDSQKSLPDGFAWSAERMHLAEFFGGLDPQNIELALQLAAGIGIDLQGDIDSLKALGRKFPRWGYGLSDWENLTAGIRPPRVVWYSRELVEIPTAIWLLGSAISEVEIRAERFERLDRLRLLPKLHTLKLTNAGDWVLNNELEHFDGLDSMELHTGQSLSVGSGLATLTALRTLKLQCKTALHLDIPAAPMPQIEEISIRADRLFGGGTWGLQGFLEAFPNLKNLSFINLKELNINALAICAKLEKLRLINCAMTDDLASFSDWPPELQSIQCTTIGQMSRIPKSWASLKKLHHLDLESMPKLEDISVLYRCKQLKTLRLRWLKTRSNAPISAHAAQTQIQRLERALPTTEILWTQ